MKTKHWSTNEINTENVKYLIGDSNSIINNRKGSFKSYHLSPSKATDRGTIEENVNQ